jgi:hypothetical protein
VKLVFIDIIWYQKEFTLHPAKNIRTTLQDYERALIIFFTKNNFRRLYEEHGNFQFFIFYFLFFIFLFFVFCFYFTSGMHAKLIPTNKDTFFKK